MGADLIGYMCIGPKKITEKQRNEAIDHAKDIVQWMKEWANQDPYYVEPPDHLIGMGIDDASYVEEYACMTHGQTEKLVDEIIAFWDTGDARDCQFRSINQTKKVMFVGEMSWGDEPSGYGFRMIKTLFILDLGKVLKIE